MISIEEAINNIELTNDNIISIAKNIVAKYVDPIDDIIRRTETGVNQYNNDILRALIIDLSYKAYSLSEAKEYSLLKSEIAEALTKEALALEFNKAEGTVEARRNNATLNASNEQLAEMLYSTIASLLKVKNDECHRIVDTLKTVIMTRNTEAKINQNITDIREGM